jgi:hypothetical protein
MSYRFNDGYVTPNADGYVRFLKDGYAAAFTFDGYNVAFFTNSGNLFDSAQGVVYLLNSAAPPDGNVPTGGGWAYAEDGDGFWSSPAGLIQSFTGTLITRAFPSDANYTAVIADYKAKIMEFTGAITVTRDVAVPLVAGYQWTIFNNTSGAQSIRVIGSSGTGITIANGMRAIVYADGTNIVRVTPDT